MAVKNLTLLDLTTRTYVEREEITPAMVGGRATGYRIIKDRLRGGLADGVDVITVENGELTFTVLPTRGMGIWKAWHGTEELGWKSPVHGPVHPKFADVGEPSGLGWLDGFDELFVRCG